MTPSYTHLPLHDLLEELRKSISRDGVPPMDLVVALMGLGIDVEKVMEQMELLKEVTA